jgi:DNA modification methylase
LIIVGDALKTLRTMPDESVHCVVTSPPYYGLRDYKIAGQIGLEKTPAEYVAKIVEVFEEVRRVLRKDGTCWVNIGDSYSSVRADGQCGDASPGGCGHQGYMGHAWDGVKKKDLIGIPWRMALALQAAGWYLRSEIVWAKPNPMPESVTDRPTRAHEQVFLFTKSPRYWYDAGAIKTPAKAQYYKMPDGWDTGPGAHGSYHRAGREAGKVSDKQRGHGRRHAGFNDRWDAMAIEGQSAMGANARTVWTIAPFPYKKAHYATFPPEIPKRCILAGCPLGGTVLDPFLGSGTTAAVAVELGRNWTGIEINPEYAELARRRIADAQPCIEGLA